MDSREESKIAPVCPEKGPDLQGTGESVSPLVEPSPHLSEDEPIPQSPREPLPPSAGPSETELVSESFAEHAGGRQSVADRTFREVYRTVLAMGRSAGFAEPEQRELAQRVGMILVEKAHEIDPSKGNARMWTVGIARNVLREMIRAERLDRARVERGANLRDIPSSTLTPEETRSARELLERLLKRIRPVYRAVIQLDAEGWTASEMAEKLGLSRSNVEWRMREGRRALLAALASLHETSRTITTVRQTPPQGGRVEAHLPSDLREEDETELDLLEEETPLSRPPEEEADSRVPAGLTLVLSGAGQQAVKPARSSWLGASVIQPIALAAAVVLALAGALSSLSAGTSARTVGRGPVRLSANDPLASLEWVPEKEHPKSPSSHGETPHTEPRAQMETRRDGAVVSPVEKGISRDAEVRIRREGAVALPAEVRSRHESEVGSRHESEVGIRREEKAAPQWGRAAPRERRDMVVTRTIVGFRRSAAAHRGGGAGGSRANGGAILP